MCPKPLLCRRSTPAQLTERRRRKLVLDPVKQADDGLLDPSLIGTKSLDLVAPEQQLDTAPKLVGAELREIIGHGGSLPALGPDRKVWLKVLWCFWMVI